MEQKQCRLRSTPQKTKNKNQGDWKATFELSRKINEKVVTPCNRNKRKQPIKAIRLPRRKVARNKLCIGGVVREWFAK